MTKVKLRDLKIGDSVTVFGAYEKKKYTINYIHKCENHKGEEVVEVAMQSEDDGLIRVSPYMSADREVTLWEENTTSTEFQIEEVARMLSSIANSVQDINAKSNLMQAVDYVIKAYNSLRKELE